MSEKARLAVHNGVLVPTLMYGSECWVWQTRLEPVSDKDLYGDAFLAKYVLKRER